MPNYIKKIILPDGSEYNIKDNYYEIDGTYDASTNKIATQSTVDEGINNLGTAAKANVANTVSNNTNLPTGAAIISYFNANPQLEFIESTNTNSSAVLNGQLSAYNLTNDKLIIYMTKYQLPNQEQSVQLTYPTGSITPVYPLYAFGTTRSKIAYPAGVCIAMVFHNGAFYLINNGGAIY